jgi:Domain of unknown function (DUF5658)
MNKILSIYTFLQLADMATTAVTMRLGGVEINPLVHVFMSVGPLLGLLLAKLVAMIAAMGCVFLKKPRPLRCANLVFAGIVAWNLSIIARLLVPISG